MTHSLIQAGLLLNLPVLDHLILARRGCSSFRRQQEQQDQWLKH